MSTNDKIAVPRNLEWGDRAAQETRRREAEREREAGRYPPEEPNKPPPPAGYGSTRPAGVDLAKLTRIEIQCVGAKGRARSLDDEAALYRQEARASAMAAFIHSRYVPAGERYDLATVRGFLETSTWPERTLAAENISVGDLRASVRAFEIAAAFAAAAGEAAKEAATLNQLLTRLKEHAEPQPRGFQSHAMPASGLKSRVV